MRLSVAAAASPDSSIERLFCENEPEPRERRARADELIAVDVSCSVLPIAWGEAVERSFESRRPRPLESRVVLADRALVGSAPEPERLITDRRGARDVPHLRPN